jgi:serine/threonine protein kinase
VKSGLALYRGYTIRCSRGSYVVEDPLFEGGMGRLFIGRSQAGKKVVIKEPKILGNEEDPIRIEKLKVEGQILSAISHRNIVKYIDSMDNGTIYFLVTEFILGKTMKEIFLKNPLDEASAKHYILTILHTLSYLHNLNIIHRDVKPDNVLVSNNDLVVIDFGGAKYGYMQAPLSFGNTVVGTPGWSAPEQFAGVATPRCDIYGAGAIMFFLLTGSPPQMSMKPDGSVDSPRRLNPKITPETESIVLKAMSLDPSKRYQIADDMVRAIQGQTLQNAPFIFCRGRRYPVTGRLTIGRKVPCDVIIDDNMCYVGRHHADVYFEGGKYWIEDINSKNGTFIYRNGYFQQITRAELHEGDLVALCYKKDKGPYISLTFKKGD